jgi:hypothetical protein
MINEIDAVAFSHVWADAWNRRDVETVLALLWQIIHAACLRRSIFGSAGIAAAAVER